VGAGGATNGTRPRGTRLSESRGRDAAGCGRPTAPANETHAGALGRARWPCTPGRAPGRGWRRGWRGTERARRRATAPWNEALARVDLSLGQMDRQIDNNNRVEIKFDADLRSTGNS
jgi:hypothetical protein